MTSAAYSSKELSLALQKKGIVALVCFIFYVDNELRTKSITKTLLVSLPICVIMTLAAVLVPTTKDALLIYGIGGTLDYVKSNDRAKKIPDKVIIALDKYLGEVNEEEKEED